MGLIKLRLIEGRALEVRPWPIWTPNVQHPGSSSRAGE